MHAHYLYLGKNTALKAAVFFPIRYYPTIYRERSCMITAKQYTDTYVEYKRMLREYNENIERSTETRKTLIKNADTADVLDLLQEAVNCIYDLTGDQCFLKQVTESIERRRTN